MHERGSQGRAGQGVPRSGNAGHGKAGLIPLHTVLPRFQDPAIKYEAPLWHARAPGRRSPTITVAGSTRIEAKFRAAQQLGCHVQIVVVTEVYDPKRARFGAVA